MLNKCIPWYSCGTQVPYWTDIVPSDKVGVIVTGTTYGVVVSHCKYHKRPLQVMRCSDRPDDLIYRYIGVSSYPTCTQGFCGMN